MASVFSLHYYTPDALLDGCPLSCDCHYHRHCNWGFIFVNDLHCLSIGTLGMTLILPKYVPNLRCSLAPLDHNCMSFSADPRNYFSIISNESQKGSAQWCWLKPIPAEFFIWSLNSRHRLLTIIISQAHMSGWCLVTNKVHILSETSWTRPSQSAFLSRFSSSKCPL